MRCGPIAIASLSAVGALAQSRPVFPYSMVPGGITSASEWQAHRSDALYRICRLGPEPARPAQLRRSISRYVSFQRDGAGWWTARPIALARRELVMIIGGEIALRGRCGNCLTSVPPPPRLRVPFVPPDTPITPAVVPVWLPPLLTSLTPPDWRTPFELTPPATIPPAPPTVTPVPPVAPPYSPRPVPATFAPYPNVFYPAVRTIAVLPAAAAPEPGTWWLLAGALALLSGVRLWRKVARP